ncbi:MAG: thiamine phosphate synthase [Pseudomonadota bacterium]
MIEDIAVYVLLDPEHAGGHAIPDLASAAARNGASLLQVRDKHGHARGMIELTRACIDAVAGTGVPVVVNDRVDVAIAAGAAGVHVGQTDIPPAQARAMLGSEAIVGLTVKTEDHLREAPLDVVSYFGMGGVFATQTKQNPNPPIGLSGLTTLVGAARAVGFQGPLAGIAGIDASNAADVVRAGADGVCVISAVSAARDPGAAVNELVRIVRTARNSDRG